MSEKTETIQSRFKQIIRERGLNKKEFIEKTGIPKSTFYYILKGDKDPTFSVTKQLCSSLNVSADWLLFGIGKKFRSNKSV